MYSHSAAYLTIRGAGYICEQVVGHEIWYLATFLFFVGGKWSYQNLALSRGVDLVAVSPLEASTKVILGVETISISSTFVRNPSFIFR